MDRHTTPAGMPRFSIVIPLYNRVLFTTICARALAAVADRWAETEVLLVDNGSTDDTAAYLATLRAPFRVITNRENAGFARACNRGAAAATGAYVIFLNNDTVPQPGWLTALDTAMMHDPASSIVGARLLFPDESVQHAGIAFNARNEPVHLHYGEPVTTATHSCPVPAVTGACLMIDRTRFLALGGFDEGYRNGFEDLDLCCRVRQEGGNVWYEATSTLYHFESASAGRYVEDHANYDRFRERWAAWLATDPLVHASAVEAQTPVRLTRAYATGADVRRELDRVIADALAYQEEFIRLDAAYHALTVHFRAQEAWARALEADATRVRQRNRVQRVIGTLLGM